MNPHLALLLSKVHDGALAPEHRDDLRASTLNDETIAAQFIRSVPLSMIGPLLGFSLPAIRSALLFPFRSPRGGFLDHVRLKIFPSLTGANGHTIKYLQPKGIPPRLYLAAAALDKVLYGEDPLWIVEGEKKCLAVAQLGLPAVGICGVEGWHRKGSPTLLSDFDAIPLGGRIVEVLPDGDFQHNPDVRRAICRLGEALVARGARPRAVLLPRPVSR